MVVTDDGTPNLEDRETITVTVSEVNQAPVLGPIGDQTIDEGSLLSVAVSAFDGDSPANLLTYSISAPSGMTVDPSSGIITWTPTEVQGPGTYSVVVTVTDVGTPSESDATSFAVTVIEVNSPPVVNSPGDQTSSEGELVSLTVTASDPDLPANSLTFSTTGLPTGLVIDPASGTISGFVDYAADLGSPYSVTITVTDDGVPNLEDQATFTWTIIDNAGPFANADTYSVDEGDTLNVSAPGVLGNDSDPEGDPLSATVVSNPSRGSLTLDPDGSFSYVHTAEDGQDDTFIYRASDGAGGSSIAVVTIVVRPINDAPIAADDFLELDEDTVGLIDVLANDSDPDGDPISIVEVTQPSLGVARVTESGAVEYFPLLNFFGSESFTYTVADDEGGTAVATVLVKVLPINDAPVGVLDQVVFTNYQSKTVNVLDNDWDPDGDLLTVASITSSDFGSVTPLDGGAIRIVPADGWTGTASFAYTVIDPDGLTDVVDVTVSLSEEALDASKELSERLGTPDLLFDPPPPILRTGGVLFNPAESVTLLVNAFYQTVQALRLPLSFLLLALGVLVSLGAATRLPLLLAGVRRRYWSVVLLDRESVLPAYLEPGGPKVVYNFDPTARGIVSGGKPVKVGGQVWIPVDTPNGEGWVSQEHLTEQVDLEAFMGDQRPAKLVDDLAGRLRAGEELGRLVANRGLLVALTGPPAQIPPDRLRGLLGESRLRRLRNVAGALDAEDDFRVAVARPFLEAYEATSDISAATPHSRRALIPTECWNFPYLALGGSSASQPWLVFFEYRKGKAYIVGLGIDE